MYYGYTTESCCEHMEGVVNIYLFVNVCQAISLSVCGVCLYFCFCVCLYDRKPSVNSAPRCVDHTARYIWYKVPEVRQDKSTITKEIYH